MSKREWPSRSDLKVSTKALMTVLWYLKINVEEWRYFTVRDRYIEKQIERMLKDVKR